MYLIIDKANGFFEEIIGNKYLTLVPTNESKEIIRRKIEDWIGSITKNADDYEKKYWKIKFNLDDNLPLNS